MKELAQDQGARKFVFYSDDAFINHVGSHYEKIILQAETDMKEVITIKNIYGCTSSIPLDRALNLLHKYYKMNKQANKRHLSLPKDSSVNKEVMPDDFLSEKEKVKISPPKNISAKTVLANSI